MFGDLGSRTLPLHRQHPTAGFEQRQTPTRELVQRRHRSGRDDVDPTRGVAHGSLLGASANHGDRQAEEFDDLGQELSPPQQRLDQSDGDVRPGQPQRNARQPRAATHVGNPVPRVQEFGNRGAVEDVPFPQTIDFAGPDQPTLYTGTGQNRGILLCQLQPVTEYRRCG